MHGRIGRGHLLHWHHGLWHGGRGPRGVRHLRWRNHGRGSCRVLSGGRCGHTCCRCDGKRTLPGGNLHGKGVHADLNRRSRSGRARRRHARAGARGRCGSRELRRCDHRGRRSACTLQRTGSRTRRQDGRRHYGGPHGRKGLGRRWHRRLGHADGRRHGHRRGRRCRRVHIWGRHKLGRRCGRSGLELGPAAQAELVEILVFFTATRTGDHDRPSARIVGVGLFIERFLPRLFRRGRAAARRKRSRRARVESHRRCARTYRSWTLDRRW